MSETITFQKFLNAIAADHDDQTEQLVPQLTPADEAALLALLQAPDMNQRWWAARALAHCGTSTAVPGLLAALDHEDSALRSAAALALGHLYIGEPDAVRPVLDQIAAKLSDDDGMVRQTAADALVLCGNDAVPALAQILQGTHEGARTRAAYALRKIATMKAAGVLYHCLNDTNYLVHMYAYEGLDELGLLENILVVV
ncbi:MAG: HEAT repeat domain-containing protein [Caldilineaceae bacterium]